MAAVSRPLPNRLAARAWSIYHGAGFHEAVVVVIAFLIYFLIRGAVVGRGGEAVVRGINLIELEQTLGIYWELEMQSWILDRYWAIKAMNWIYFWGHMPLVIIIAIWLWGWHRSTYTLTRNAFLASGAIGVVMYATLPLAPPRLIPFAGFVDTMAVYDRVGYNAQETRAFVNQYAAMPSLHFGWSLLLGWVVVWVARRNPFAVLFGITWPIAMFFAVIMTGNHFILDAVVGGIVSFAGLGIAFAVRHYQPRTAAWARSRFGLEPPTDPVRGP